MDPNIPEESMDTSQEPEETESEERCSDTDDMAGASFSCDADVSSLDVSLNFHDYDGVPEQSKIRHQCEQTVTAKLVSVATETDEEDKKHIIHSYAQTPVVEKCNFTTQTKRPLLVFEDIESDDSKVNFYTGIPDAKTFLALFEELEKGMEKETENGRPRSLRLIDEFFMVLMRLRLGLLLEDLSDRFNISTSTCSAIFNQWIDYLDTELEFLVMWPSREIIDNTMPRSFCDKYPKCRVIVDCTEIRTETPSSLQLRSLLYSEYKSHMTYKSLIGISPAGVVTFVSDLYSGSISDKQITKLSGLVNLCEEGDAIMADKGFLISDLTTPKGVNLIIPPFKRKRQQLSKREVIETRKIANLRIHVERQMERIKNFRILQGIMPITMAAQSSKIWKICVRLTNLQPPLVLKR